MQPKITMRELYPLIMDKQFNLITQLINKNVILKKVRPLQYFDPRSCMKGVNIVSLDFKYPVDSGFRYVYADEMQTEKWKTAATKYFSLVGKVPHAFINGYTSDGSKINMDCGKNSNIAKMLVT